MKGNWIITRTGKKVYPLDFRPEMFDIEDVAHALSMLCRYTGHCPFFYSVAEHSVIVSDEVLRLGGSDKDGLQALLHDAAEAYIADVSQPLKHCEEFAFYKVVERGIEQTIYELHGLPKILDPKIKEIDAGMLLKEGYQFFPESIAEWTYPPKDTPIPSGRILCQEPTVAKHRFLTRYRALVGNQGFKPNKVFRGV